VDRHARVELSDMINREVRELKTMLRLFPKFGARTGWLFPCALIVAVLTTASPAEADRPGTPTDMHLFNCRNSTVRKPMLCGTFINRADEEVTFEYGFAIKDSKPLRPNLTCDMQVAGNNMCFFEGSKYKGKRHRKLEFQIKDLEFNTEYCMRVRARRTSDSMVSGTYSNSSCVRTDKQPSKPGPPTISVRFLGTQYGPNGTMPEKLEITSGFSSGDAGRLNIIVRDGEQHANSAPLLSTPKGAIEFPLPLRLRVIRVEVCAENVSGRTCNTKIVNPELPGQVDGPVACKQGEVWRERFNGDTVCVHPDQRWVMEDGSCRPGWEKIGVGPKKDTCGTPEKKAKAEADAVKAEATAAKDMLRSSNPQDFAGSWSTTKKGETIILNLQVNGNEVTGDFASSSNPENKGTLTGTIKAVASDNGQIVQLRYTSNQPTEANGTFWVFTDGKLEGGYTVREAGKAKKTYYKWHGTRASN